MSARTDNFKKFSELRSDFPFFSYDAFDYRFIEGALKIRFSFSLSGRYHFSPVTVIPWNDRWFRPYENLSGSILDDLIFHIGMIELISYWKAACPQRVIIRPKHLSDEQKAFFTRLYYDGLGEFFWMNSISISEEEFVKMETPGPVNTTVFAAENLNGALLPVGGGKDSAVAMSLADRFGIDWIPFVVNPRRATREVISAAGKPDSDTIIFNREIDPELLRLNEQGFLNGHTPFSALLAFQSLLAGYLAGRKEIILANESSASEPTVPGTRINHQYSKSIEFEQDFRNYCRDHISPSFNYFSLLRPLSELRIAGLFASLPQFHQAFRSCNAGSKTGTWCGKCPKCLFTFIILSPFLDPDRLIDIFGHNLLNDPGLLPVFRQLTGREDTKPFDCIGTPAEINTALAHALKKYEGKEIPFLLNEFLETTGPENQNFYGMMCSLDSRNFLPPQYFKLFKELI